MTTASCIAQARKMNHAAIAARRLGHTATAELARQFRILNMFHAGVCQLNGR